MKKRYLVLVAAVITILGFFAAVNVGEDSDTTTEKGFAKKRPTKITTPTTTKLVTTTTRQTTTTIQPSNGSCVGTQVSPGANLQTTLTNAGNGATICFSPGTYPLSGFLIPLSGQKLISTQPRKAIITGLDVYNGGIRGYGGPSGQQNITIDGLVVTHMFNNWDSFPRASITAGFNWTINNVEVSWNAQCGIEVNSGTKLTNSFIDHNGRYGFCGGIVDNVLIDSNELSFNNTAKYDPGNDAGGSKISGSSPGSHSIKYSNNNAHDNYGMALWCDWDCQYVTFDSNYGSNNGGALIFLEASFDAAIYNNKASNNCKIWAGQSILFCAEIILNDSQRVFIDNNIVQATTNGIAGTDSERGSTPMGVLMLCEVTGTGNSVTGPNPFQYRTLRTNPCSTIPWAVT